MVQEEAEGGREEGKENEERLREKRREAEREIKKEKENAVHECNLPQCDLLSTSLELARTPNSNQWGHRHHL